MITFLIFLFMAVRIYELLTKACEMLGEMIYSLVSAKRIRDLLDGPEQREREDVQVGQSDITFDHVSFGYNREDVIHDVSFTAKQGEITALVSLPLRPPPTRAGSGSFLSTTRSFFRFPARWCRRWAAGI